MNTQNLFAKTLLNWSVAVPTRHMPWKGERDPYLVWLSEIILQQTRVAQGLPYYLRFREKFPTVQHLAAASEDEVMRLWQGLGYYNRARNLHATAKHIAYNMGGKFPDNYRDLLQLKGVGSYTAAAIASFVYGEPQAVVDGNVIRVLARYFGVTTPFDTPEGKKEFSVLAKYNLAREKPAAYNQAIMDFGALICTPQKPACGKCPLRKTCFAQQYGLHSELPYRSKKAVMRTRYFYYLLDENTQGILLRKRPKGDIWQGLYEMPMVETDKALKRNIAKVIAKSIALKKERALRFTHTYTQLLSHQVIHFAFAEAQLKNTRNYMRIKHSVLGQLGFPRTLHLFLQEKGLL